MPRGWQIAPDKRACIAWSGHLPGGRQRGNNRHFARCASSMLSLQESESVGFGWNSWREPLTRASSARDTLRERSRKVERRKGKRYGSELRRQAVEKMNACGNIVGLARELGVSRRVLYQWRDRMEQTDSSPGRSRELILRKQILKLKRLLANKTLEVDFFRHALQRVGARRRQSFHPGDKATKTRVGYIRR
jgi:hypothetical protein